VSRLRLPAVLVLAACALAACSREAEAPPPERDDTAVEAPEPAPEPAPPPRPVEAPPPPPAIEENAAETADEPVDHSEQTLEDADATGLTTRASPGAEEEDVPVEEAAGVSTNQ